MLKVKGQRFDILSPAQCRAARSLLNLSQVELAEKSQVSRPTIAEFERGARTPYAPNLTAMARVFDESGIELLKAGPEGGEGARFKAGWGD